MKSNKKASLGDIQSGKPFTWGDCSRGAYFDRQMSVYRWADNYVQLNGVDANALDVALISGNVYLWGVNWASEESQESPKSPELTCPFCGADSYLSCSADDCWVGPKGVVT